MVVHLSKWLELGLHFYFRHFATVVDVVVWWICVMVTIDGRLGWPMVADTRQLGVLSCGEFLLKNCTLIWLAISLTPVVIGPLELLLRRIATIVDL